jgi:hypothetical protein
VLALPAVLGAEEVGRETTEALMSKKTPVEQPEPCKIEDDSQRCGTCIHWENNYCSTHEAGCRSNDGTHCTKWEGKDEARYVDDGPPCLTHDRLPCPGTCVTLAGELEEECEAKRVLSEEVTRLRCLVGERAAKVASGCDVSVMLGLQGRVPVSVGATCVDCGVDEWTEDRGVLSCSRCLKELPARCYPDRAPEDEL